LSDSDQPAIHELLGVPPPAKTGRERLLAVAIRLFYAHGIHAIGLDRIIEEAGVTKTTFYNHFESRDDLVLQAVRMRDGWESAAWRAAMAKLGGHDPAKRLRAFFDIAEVWFTSPDFRGCMFVNTVAEFPNRNDPVHKAAAAHKQATRDHCRDLARDAGATDPEGFADQFTALFEGTLILRHAHDRDDAVEAVRPALDALFTAHGI